MHFSTFYLWHEEAAFTKTHKAGSYETISRHTGAWPHFLPGAALSALDQEIDRECGWQTAVALCSPDTRMMYEAVNKCCHACTLHLCSNGVFNETYFDLFYIFSPQARYNFPPSLPSGSWVNSFSAFRICVPAKQPAAERETKLSCRSLETIEYSMWFRFSQKDSICPWWDQLTLDPNHCNCFIFFLAYMFFSCLLFLLGGKQYVLWNLEKKISLHSWHRSCVIFINIGFQS